MKKLITIISAAILGLTSFYPVYAAEEKKVCIPVKDKEGKPVNDKNGKPREDCKMVKVHKKLEGTEVPGQKK